MGQSTVFNEYKFLEILMAEAKRNKDERDKVSNPIMPRWLIHHQGVDKQSIA